MEKYPIFSGLNSLNSRNLSLGKTLLPKIGTVGKLIKSGEIVTFDLDSKDVWLDVQVECIDLKLVIFFEARVAKIFKLDSMKNYLTEIVNQILKANKIELRYDIEDIDVKKMHLHDENFAVKNLRSSALAQDQLPQFLREIEKDLIISEVFGYLDRCLLAEFEKKFEGHGVKKMNFSEMPSEVEKKMLNMSSELPIRGLRVEGKKDLLDGSKVRSRRAGKVQAIHGKICSCEVF